MKFTLMALGVSILFVGMNLADTVGNPTDRISRNNTAAGNANSRNNSTEPRLATLFPGDGSFLSSLRFWERNRGQPQAAPQVTPQAALHGTHEETITGGPLPLMQQSETRAVVHRTPTIEQIKEQIEVPATQPNPVPAAVSPSPYPERRGGVLGDAPLPGQTISYTPRVGDTPVPQDVSPNPPSHSSYSFDIRDWVEYFHLHGQEEENFYEEIVYEDVYEEAVTEIQTASYREPITAAMVFQPPPPPENYRAENQWNGETVPLVVSNIAAPSNAIPVAPVAAPFERPLLGKSAMEKPPLDLSPSYQQRLQYTQTYGVVVVQANFPLTEIASILDEIKQLQYDLTHYIGVPAPQEKIELCLFRDETSYNNFLKEYFPRAPLDRRALYIKLDGKPGTLLVQKSRHFEVDLRHEMTHAIVHASIPKVPIWLDEGLAKYFEVPAQDRAMNHPYMSRTRMNTKLGMVPSLDRLTKLETIDDMQAKEYQDSWAWTHFMIHRSPETHRLLAAYLQMLATWNPEAGQKNTASSNAGSEGTLKTIFDRMRTKQSSIPSLKAYLDDVIPNQREAFKEHFGAVEK